LLVVVEITKNNICEDPIYKEELGPSNLSAVQRKQKMKKGSRVCKNEIRVFKAKLKK